MNTDKHGFEPTFPFHLSDERLALRNSFLSVCIRVHPWLNRGFQDQQ